MKKALLFPAIALVTVLAAGQAARRPAPETKAADESCVLEGMVYRDDGVPMKNVAVNAVSQQLQSGRARVFSTLTGADGKFVLSGVEPGLYVLEALRPNFLRARYGQRRPGDEGVTFSLRAQQKLTGLEFHLRPAAVLSGRVFDEDGDVVVGARVTALRWGYRFGRRDLLPVEAAFTDDRGEYRIHQLAPGHYYLYAALLAGGSNALAQLRAVANPGRTMGKTPPFVPTFYPGSAEVAGANEVPISFGDQLENINFRMLTSVGQKVSGWVRYSNGEPARSVQVALSARLEQSAYGQPQTKVTDEDGSFEFENVYPGAYFLTSLGREPVYMGREMRVTIARLELQVGSVELKNVVLAMAPGNDVTATVRLESNEPGRSMAALRSLRLALEPQDGIATANTAMISVRAGSFTSYVFRSVLDGDYALRVSGLPEDIYISSLKVAGREMQEDSYAVRGRGGNIEVMLSTGAGTVSGAVTDAHDQPYAGVRVVLVPEESLRRRSDLYKTITTDRKGNYVIKGVAPGTYKLFAWEQVEDGAWQDAEFLAAYETLGTRVEVEAKGQETVGLRLIASGGE